LAECAGKDARNAGLRLDGARKEEENSEKGNFVQAKEIKIAASVS
jgi:hypothetical protein